MTDALSPELTRDVLAFLQVDDARCCAGLLEKLISNYTRIVPWESATRIAKRARVSDTQRCPRWSDEFWLSAMRFGTGGTCFESNRAYFALLRSLGFEGYLTINNMRESVGCHTAIVIVLDGEKWLVDAGYPIDVPLRLDPNATTTRISPIHDYIAQPIEENIFEITRTRHPDPYIFTLIDKPIDDATYCDATTRDYGEGGLFLDRVVIRKTIDDAVHRFNSGRTLSVIEIFSNGVYAEKPILDDVAEALSKMFGIENEIVREALMRVQTDSI
jgi:arylamine N-acetyltransferase